MSGLARICEIYGSITVNNVKWLWDYVNRKPRLESEMTKEEIALSEKAKWNNLKNK